ncbi:murein biosynthesis integral membrane protein MurJ [Patescibacteria group bacterium]|nr:murein biosynthesis integral membrane protein MurJ [Patescibacteria group bacterium]
MINGKLSLARTQNTILSAAFVLSITTGFNAVLGFAKNRLLAHFFGVSNQLAIFYTADRIPNLIYSILVIGVVSTVFIPTFTSLKKQNKEVAHRTATSMIISVLIAFIAMGILIFIFAPQILSLLAVGNFTADEIYLGVNIMRIMILAQVLLVGGSLATSVLQSYKYFIVPALAPVFYNLGMMFGTFFFSSEFGIYGPTFGVLIGALLHVGIQIPLLLRSEFKFHVFQPFKDTHMLETLKLVPSRIAQVTLAGLVQTINNSLALLISASSVVYLKFANQLQFFPVGIFGMSIASAALPTLSTQSDPENIDKFKRSLYTSLHQMLFLVMPISMILFVLRVPSVRIVYGVSNFPWEATIKTSYVLGFFSVSIFAQSANYILTRAFFALKNTKIPVNISIISSLFNVSTAFTLVHILGFGVWSVALVYSVSAILETVFLVYFLSPKVNGINPKKIIIPFVKISYATVMMGATIYGGLKLLDITVLDTTKTLNMLILTALTTLAGCVTYLFFTYMLKVEEIQLFYELVKRLNLSRFIKNNQLSAVNQNQID